MTCLKIILRYLSFLTISASTGAGIEDERWNKFSQFLADKDSKTHEKKGSGDSLSHGMFFGDNQEGIKDDKLFLTPFMVRGNYEEGRSLSFVDPEFSPVRSHSGFFTVNVTFNTNLFFWFFPAAYNPREAPVLLWLNGGPGSSSLFGLFAENGPFYVDNKGYLNMRTNSWALTHSVLYIDNPTGVGFSFTEDEDGFARDMGHVAGDLYSALIQFFLLFPKYVIQDFYISGQGFAAKYCTAVARKIHEENRNSNPTVKINIKGLLLFSPMIDPLAQANYGPFLHSIGLIDTKQKEHFDEQRAELVKLYNKKQWLQIHDLMDKLLMGDLYTYETYFTNVTGFHNHLNYFQPFYPPTYSSHRDFLRQEFVRSAIHVGSQKYRSFSKKVMRSLLNEIYQPDKSGVEKLLNDGYEILIVSGQLDILAHSQGVDQLVHDLDWKGMDDFKKANRTLWKVNDEIGGYIKTCLNLAFVSMRNAGHAIPHDKPSWSFRLINEFTTGFLFDDYANSRIVKKKT